ncbi:MAG TPA: hypothetical protein EYO37_10975 [Nitrospina sp.]|nr:hypothetical protein [Nitrospina sp.]
MKIGVQILAYNCKEAFPRLIEPWAKLKEEFNFKFWVNSRQFRIYEEMGCEDVNADTLKMLRTDYSELIDCLSVPEKTLSDHETRSSSLEYFEKEDVDLIWILDADEFYTEEEIRNTIKFVQENPQYDWYRLQFKNYIGDENEWVEFVPVRIIWTKRHGGIKHHYYDVHFSYNDDSEYRKHPNTTIPRDMVFPDHYSWTLSKNTTGPVHIKEKIEYQKIYYHGECGYSWDETKQALKPFHPVFNELKNGEDSCYIAEIQTVGGIPRMVYDKFDLFEPPFFSPGRINFSFSPSATEIEGEVIGAVFHFDQRNDFFTTYKVAFSDDLYYYWSYPQLDDFTEDLIVKFYV